MLEQLRDDRVVVDVMGDGAGDMVGAIASRGRDGDIAIVVWNGTADVTKFGGEPLLDRDVELTVTRLPARQYEIRHRRLDEHHSNLNRAWAAQARDRDWPDERGWQDLRDADRLEDLEPVSTVAADGGSVTLSFALPMPAVSLIELTPTS
jgi:xylan 1,4-beta-xylosidase